MGKKSLIFMYNIWRLVPTIYWSLYRNSSFELFNPEKLTNYELSYYVWLSVNKFAV